MDVVWPNSLRELRQQRAIDTGAPVHLEDVAGAVDCSIGYLSRLEKGRQRPDRALLEELARFYGVPVSQIEKPGAKVEITPDKIVGAWIRVQRQKRRMSIEALARALPTQVSSSQIRLIEAGQRSFRIPGPVIDHLVAFLGMRSLNELETGALQAHKAGELDHALRELHPQLSREKAGARAFIVGTDEAVDLPEHVRARLSDGEVAFLVPELSLGLAASAVGAFCITRPGEPLRDGIIFDRGRLAVMIDGHVQTGRGVPSSGAFNVLAVVPLID